MAFNVYFIRHGQTILNKYNRMQGWCDSPLTAKGLADAKEVGQKLAEIKFDHAFHSDTMRAQNTCLNLLAQNKHETPTPAVMPEFREQGYGYFEGADSGNAWMMIGGPHGCRTFKELITTYSIEEARNFAKEADPFNDAENDADFQARIDLGLAKLRQQAHDGQNIVIVSHGTTIRSLVHRFAPETDITIGPRNGSITKFSISDDQVNLEFYNH